MTLFLQTEKVVFLVLAIFYLRQWLLGRPTGLDIVAIWEALTGLPDKNGQAINLPVLIKSKPPIDSKALFRLEKNHPQRQENNSKAQQDSYGRQNLFDRLAAYQNIFQTLHAPISRENLGCVLHHFREKLNWEPST